MDYYLDESNVAEYIRMAAGFEGTALVEKLKNLLEPGDTVLELGIGPGKDLDLLQRSFCMTGSDISEIFLNLYREKHPEADLLILDAITIHTDRRFQGIYSNKVLHHLTREEFQKSLQRQAEILHSKGVALHSLWHGDGDAFYHGLRATYYRPKDLENLIPEEFEILELSFYAEMDKEDSICLILRKTQ